MKRLFRLISILFSLLPASIAAQNVYGNEDVPAYSFVPLLLLATLFILPAILYRFNGLLNAAIGLTSVLLAGIFLFLGSTDVNIELLVSYISHISILVAFFFAFSTIDFELRLQGTPEVNTFYLALVAVIANAIGSPGATIVFAPAFLRMNRNRRKVLHIPVFFILVVTNAGGILSPLGSVATYQQYVRLEGSQGFSELLPFWLITQAIILFIFFMVDWMATTGEGVRLDMRKDLSDRIHRAVQNQKVNQSLLLEVQEYLEKPVLSVRGVLNILGMAAILGIISFFHRTEPAGTPVRELLILFVSFAVYFIRGRIDGFSDNFRWADFFRVTTFYTISFVIIYYISPSIHEMITRWSQNSSDSFLAAITLLSGFIDSSSIFDLYLAGKDSLDLMVSEFASPGFSRFAAVELDMLFMAIIVVIGGLTYTGNIFNYMVKSMADEEGIRSPGFFHYMLYSVPVLLIVMASLFFIVQYY